MEFVIVVLLVIIFLQWTIPKHRASEIKKRDQKINDSVILIKEAAMGITLLEAEIKKQDQQLEEYERRIALLTTEVKQKDLLIDDLSRWKEGAQRYIALLRTELRKDTEQTKTRE